MRRLLVSKGREQLEIIVPDDSKLTFGPWSPPMEGGARYGSERGGTLRVYKGTKATENMLAVISGVTGFVDASEVTIASTHEEDPLPPPKMSRLSWGEMTESEKAELADWIARSFAFKAADEAMGAMTEEALPF